MKRRLAFVIHDLNSWGGHDRSTLEVARRLSHRYPVDVCSLTLNDPNGMSAWGDVRVFKIKPRIDHPVMLKSTLFYGASLWPLEALPRMRGEPRPLIHATGVCSLVSDVVQVQFVNAAWQAVRRRLDPDWVSAPRARPSTHGIGSRLRSGLIESYHEAMLRYQVAVERRVYTAGKTYVAIARGVARELEECFGLRDRVHVIHHGVDSRLFRPVESAADRAARDQLRSDWGIGDGELALAFVGAFERKGLAALIDSIGKLSRETLSRVKVVAVGSGDQAPFMERARRLGVQDRLVFTGPTRAVDQVYRAADAFVLPTVYEPFGLVIVEAMASALPVVVSALSGGGELIRRGENGLLIDDPTDAAGIARLIEQLILDPILRERMAKAARATAVARSWDQVADEYGRVIGPLLEGNRGLAA